MIRYGMSTKGVLLGALMIAPAACLGPGDITGDDGDVDLFGTIVVTTMTMGASPDPDGYLATVNEAIAQQIDANGSVTFGEVPVGTHNVLLSQLNGSCVTTTPNPVYVVLLPDSTITTQFEVSCP